MSDQDHNASSPEKQDTKYLIFEQPILLYPALAKILGSVDQAIVLQQIRFWTSNGRIGKMHKGRRWVRNSVRQWQQDNFYFWTEKMVRDALESLREKGVLDAENLNFTPFDKTTWYTVNYERLEQLAAEANIEKWLNDRFDEIGKSIGPESQIDSTELSNRFTPGGPIDLPLGGKSLSETTHRLQKKSKIITQKNSASPEVENPKQTPELKNALAVLCYGPELANDSWKTVALRVQMVRALKDLLVLQPDLTPNHFRTFGVKWAESDWRGKQGQRPIPKQVVEEWIALNPAKPPPPKQIVTWVEPQDFVFPDYHQWETEKSDEP